MNSLVIVGISIVVLVSAYLFYGKWLVKTWGIDPDAETPATTHEDGNDYSFISYRESQLDEKR